MVHWVPRKGRIWVVAGLAVVVGVGVEEPASAASEETPVGSAVVRNWDDYSVKDAEFGKESATAGICETNRVWTGAGFQGAATCSSLREGVEARVVLDLREGRAHSAWFSATDTRVLTDVFGGVNQTVLSVTVRFRASADGTTCFSQREKQEITFGYDEYRVNFGCTRIAEGVKVRGVADYSNQVDNQTAWLTAPGAATSDWQAPIFPSNKPSTRYELDLRD